MKARLLLLCVLLIPTAASAITYADWIASYGLTGDQAAPTADPDGDGVPNLIEYALDGCDPTDGNPLPARTQLVFGRRVLNTLPFRNVNAIQYEAVNSPSESNYHAGLRFRPRAGTEGIRYLVEYSDPAQGLRRWFHGRNVIAIAHDAPVEGDAIGWALQMFTKNQAKMIFFRLRIQVLP